MARIQDRRLAIRLRQEGKSWTEIRQTITVSKDTLSRWLRGVELTKEQKRKIFENSKIKRIENYLQTVKIRQEKILTESYVKAKKKIGFITKRDFLMAGLFLYLGEGSKSDRSRIQISNTDPLIIKFSIFWLTKIFDVDMHGIKIQLHLYADMDIDKEIVFWKNLTGFSSDQFIKPYVKKTTSKLIDHPSFGHGTCNLYINNTILKREIMGNIKVILDRAIKGV